MTQENEALNCPFCGSMAREWVTREAIPIHYSVGCCGVDCSAMLTWWSPEEARERWNRRASSPAIPPGYIEAIVNRLFTNGADEQADRLVLMQDGPPKYDLGGWSKHAVATQIRAALASVDQRQEPTVPVDGEEA